MSESIDTADAVLHQPTGGDRMSGWVDADSPERPKPGKDVFIAIQADGEVRTEIGFWVPRYYMKDAEDDCDDDDRECDDNDVWYLREGWYTRIYDGNAVWWFRVTITHWMLPDPPEET